MSVNLYTRIKEPAIFVLCNAAKFTYGYLFGSFVWYLLIHPYARFYDFESSSHLPELIFSLAISFIFMSSLRVRAIMVLFLPSMLGNASQNYIILLLFMALISNPIPNIALNAVETVRVIGCSLTMTFEQLKERARLLLNPIIAILSDETQKDLAPIKQDILAIQQIVVDMGREAEFRRMQEEDVTESGTLLPTTIEPDGDKISNDIGARLLVDPKLKAEIVDRTKELIRDSNIDIHYDRVALRANLNVGELRRLMKLKSSGPISQFNLTEIMYENCLSIFRIAKGKCEESAEDIRKSCQDSVGVFLSSIFCSPITFTLSSTCPWIMNQLIDENNLCSQLRASNARIRLDPFNRTGGADISEVYRNLTDDMINLGDDLFSDGNSEKQGVGVLAGPQAGFKRFELNITLNSETKNLFFKANNLLQFIKNKYKVRQLFYDFLLLLYEIYTTYTFLLIMIQAYHYNRSYLNNIRFDNHYITGLFHNLDQRRRQLNRPSVLPLTKDESHRYITTLTCKRRTNEERASQRASCLVTFIFLAFTLSLLYLDNLFYFILDSIREHAQISYRQLGEHDVEVVITGEGSFARFVRRLTEHINSVYRINKRSDTRQCLPRAMETGGKFYLNFLYLCLVYVGIDQLGIYAMRLRRITSAFFYPDKEYKRIKFLYKLIMIQRRRLAKTGLAGYIDEVVDDSQMDEDSGMFTARDAFSYLGNCVRDSWACCGNSKCCNRN